MMWKTVLCSCVLLLSCAANAMGGQDNPPPEPPASFSVELAYDGKEWNQVALWRLGYLDQPLGISVTGLTFPLFLGGGINNSATKGVIGGGVEYKFARNAHLLIGSILDFTSDRKPKVTIVLGIGVEN